MGDIRFVPMREQYLQGVLDIYCYYIKNTTATFHCQELSLEQMREIVFFDNPRYQCFVLLDAQRLCGYVLVHAYGVREAYAGTAEVALYLDPDYQGKGVGAMALQYIEDFARAQQLHVLIAAICGENTRSIRLFERSGYEKCAHYKEVGRKFGRYLDIVDYQKIL